MLNIHGNFKNDLKKKRNCPYCGNHLDTTEHVLECPLVEGSFEESHQILSDVKSNNWKKVVRTVNLNLDSRD